MGRERHAGQEWQCKVSEILQLPDVTYLAVLQATVTCCKLLRLLPLVPSAVVYSVEKFAILLYHIFAAIVKEGEVCIVRHAKGNILCLTLTKNYRIFI